MSDSILRDEHHATWIAGASRTAAATAAGALAGAFAGTAAGLGTSAAGPIGAIFGAIVGAGLSEYGSQATETVWAYTIEYDEHYRMLWESDPDRPMDGTFETARPAYRFGHVAAFQLPFVGRDFVAAEEDLRSLWERDFSTHGAWKRVRQHVCDAYGHSRGENFGIRRDATVIGTGGSGVDPVELDRARAGLASRPDTPEGDEPLFPIDLAATAPGVGFRIGGGSLGEGAEWPASRVYTEHADVG